MKKEKFNFESWQGALIIIVVYLFFLIIGTIGAVTDSNILIVGLFFSFIMFLTVFKIAPDYFNISKYLTKFLIWLPWTICAAIISFHYTDINVAESYKGTIITWLILSFSPWIVFAAIFIYSGFPNINSILNISNNRNEMAKQYAQNRYNAKNTDIKGLANEYNRNADEVMIKAMGGSNETAKQYAQNRYNAATVDSKSLKDIYNKEADKIYGKVINK